MSRLRLPLMLLKKSDVPLAARWQAVVGHVAAKLVSLTLGAASVGPAGERLRRWRDRGAARPVFGGRVALVAHVFYPELMAEVLACHSHMPADAALIVTTTEERRAEVEGLAAGIAGARVMAAGNRGRDIAPFMALLNSGALASYDAVLKIHTKRSLHLLDGDIRRRTMFAALCGSRRRVAAVLRLFDDERTGLVGWRATWRRNPFYWLDNRSRVAQLAQDMAIAPPTAPAFFEGSMFWLRPAAAERLRALHLAPDDFEAEAGQLNETLHHALERAFAMAAAADGFEVRDIAGRRLH